MRGDPPRAIITSFTQAPPRYFDLFAQTYTSWKGSTNEDMNDLIHPFFLKRAFNPRKASLSQ